jgi:hypothetical protein
MGQAPGSFAVMFAPPWLRLALAALMIGIACGSAVRLRAGLRLPRGQRAEADADGLHVLMGVAMAGMLEPRISVLPGIAWLAAFGASAAWFGWHALRSSRGPALSARRCSVPLPHLIESLAMIYMLLPATGPATGKPMPGMAMSGTGQSGLAGSSEIVALLLALSMAGYVIWTTATLTLSARPASVRDRRMTPGQAPGLAGGRLTHGLQDRYEHHHGLHADPDGLARLAATRSRR